MRNKVLRICQSCIYGLGWTFMFVMGSLIVCSIGFAFYQLFLGLLS
jgi:hypothetical protein